MPLCSPDYLVAFLTVAIICSSIDSSIVNELIFSPLPPHCPQTYASACEIEEPVFLNDLESHAARRNDAYLPRPL